MAGTQATYQGLPVRNVRFRRTRGWKADTTTIELFAADFRGFELATPAPGTLAVGRTDVRLDLSRLKRKGAPLPPPFPRRLEFAGALVLAEVDMAGREFVTAIDPLYCISVETVRTDKDGSVCVLQARLVDARYFAAQGFVRRWSWNRTTAEGTYSQDSVKPGGEPYSLAEVAKEVASSLFGMPDLKHVPARWTDVKPAIELARFSPATVALARLAQEHGAGELCLALDRSVALFAPGEGRVGYAPDGKGPSNTDDFPPALLLDLRGTGQSRGSEATYPPDFVVVVGGLRVVSVRLDDLEPVLVIEGEPFVLTEALVRKVTKNRFGLAWLHAFLLAPQSYQNAVGLDPRVLSILREQAYRLWRIPGIEVTSKGEQGRKRGPNAHLLPLLARAETVAGRRLPVRVDVYRFASVHRAMADSREAQQAGGAHRRLAELREQIRAAAQKAGLPDPWSDQDMSYGFQGRYVSDPLLYAMVGSAGAKGIAYDQFVQAIRRARTVDRIREVTPELAAQYEQETIRLYEADASLPGVGAELYSIAKEVVEFERSRVAEGRDPMETPDEQARQEAQFLRERLRDEVNALNRRLQEEHTKERIGATGAKPPQTAVFVRNLPREIDTEARLYSAELGIVRTSDLCGHVAEEGVPMAEATSFVPKSPLVTFGAVLRPRVDVSQGRPVTGTPASKNESKVPSALSDTESYYTAAFKRVAPGRVEPIDVSAVPQGQGVVVERPDLVELVPLEGDSNRATLDETASAVAQSLVAKPEKVEARKVTVARPWPVNCDGLVAGVEIVMRSNAKGFVTTIHVGSDAPRLDPLGGTRVRPRRASPSDAAAREGLLP